MNDELIIDETNFEEYFFDIRKHKPQRGQVMACFRATGEFIDGREKRDVIELLRVTKKAMAISQVMRKLQHATEGDSYRIPFEMALDLLEGMAEHDNPQLAVERVAQKPYKYTVEMFYYTQREYVPVNDPHWSIIELINLDEHISKTDRIETDQGTIEFKSEIFGEDDERLR